MHLVLSKHVYMYQLIIANEQQNECKEGTFFNQIKTGTFLSSTHKLGFVS